MSKGFLIRKAGKVVVWCKDEQDWDKSKFPAETHEFHVDDDSDPLVPELRNQIELDPNEFKWDATQERMIPKTQTEKDSESDARSDDFFDNAKSEFMLLFRAMVIELAAELSNVTTQQLDDRVKATFRQSKRSA